MTVIKIFQLLLLSLCFLSTQAYSACSLRQATNSQTILIGPFLDRTDGVTAETALNINAADIRISQSGANIVAKNSGGATHDELGLYQITLNATDTSVVGSLDIVVDNAAAASVHLKCQVYEESVYDNLFGAGTARLVSTSDLPTNFKNTVIDANGVVSANAKQWNGTAITTALSQPIDIAVASRDLACSSIKTGTIGDQICTDINNINEKSNTWTRLFVPNSTTISGIISQAVFTLTTGSSDNNAYKGCMAVITDASTPLQKAFAGVESYAGTTRQVTLDADPAIFTIAAGDFIDFSCLAASIEFINKSEVIGTGSSSDRWRGN